MFSFRTTPLAEQGDKVLSSGRLGVLCNQVAWNPEKGEYLFETLARNGNLKRVFVPSWGTLNVKAAPFKSAESDGGGASFSASGNDAPYQFVELNDDEGPFSISAEMLEDLDGLVVEFQDLGSRFDRFTSMLFALFQTLHHTGLDISVYILDRENPSGRGVEGTMLYPEAGVGLFDTELSGSEPTMPEGNMSDYRSSGTPYLEIGSTEGVEGIPHKHGLTLGELSNLFYSEIGAKFPLHIISYLVRSATQYMMPWSIPPFEDIPGLFTSTFYCGQVLLRGTNVSNGEGTSRPYEMFGAPFMRPLLKEPVTDPGVFMRWTVFTPRFGKYQGEPCYGFQMLPNPGIPYHSLAHSLRILRAVKDGCPEFEYGGLGGMIGDAILYEYVKGSVDWGEVKEHIKIEEQKWIRKAKRYLLYDDQLTRVKTLI